MMHLSRLGNNGRVPFHIIHIEIANPCQHTDQSKSILIEFKSALRFMSFTLQQHGRTCTQLWPKQAKKKERNKIWKENAISLIQLNQIQWNPVESLTLSTTQGLIKRVFTARVVQCIHTQSEWQALAGTKMAIQMTR